MQVSNLTWVAGNNEFVGAFFEHLPKVGGHDLLCAGQFFVDVGKFVVERNVGCLVLKDEDGKALGIDKVEGGERRFRLQLRLVQRFAGVRLVDNRPIAADGVTFGLVQAESAEVFFDAGKEPAGINHERNAPRRRLFEHISGTQRNGQVGTEQGIVEV